MDSHCFKKKWLQLLIYSAATVLPRTYKLGGFSLILRSLFHPSAEQSEFPLFLLVEEQSNRSAIRRCCFMVCIHQHSTTVGCLSLFVLNSSVLKLICCSSMNVCIRLAYNFLRCLIDVGTILRTQDNLIFQSNKYFLAWFIFDISQWLMKNISISFPVYGA